MNDASVPPSLVPPPPPPALKHSGLGLASLIIAVLAGVALFASFGFAGFMQMRDPESMNEKSPAAMLVGLLVIGFCLVHLLGVGLAIGALFQKDRKKVLAVLGLVMNAVAILGTVGLIVLGNSMK